MRVRVVAARLRGRPPCRPARATRPACARAAPGRDGRRRRPRPVPCRPLSSGPGMVRSRPAATAATPVGDRAPVGHDQALVAPFVAQHLGEQPVVLARVHAVDLVVGAHHGPRPGLGDHPLEGAQVHLAQGALVDVGADPHPVGLLVVDREVLQRRADAAALQAAHPRGGQHAGQQRVLGEVLEVAAAERAALEVDARAEQHRDVHRAALVAEGLAHPPQQLRVPGRAGSHRRREAGGRRPVSMSPRVRLQPNAVRPVGHGDRRECRRTRSAWCARSRCRW